MTAKVEIVRVRETRLAYTGRKQTVRGWKAQVTTAGERVQCRHFHNSAKVARQCAETLALR